MRFLRLCLEIFALRRFFNEPITRCAHPSICRDPPQQTSLPDAGGFRRFLSSAFEEKHYNSDKGEQHGDASAFITLQPPKADTVKAGQA